MAKTYIAEKAVMVITFYIHAHTFICDLSYYQFCTLYVLYYRGRHNSFNRDLFMSLSMLDSSPQIHLLHHSALINMIENSYL